MTEYEWLYIKSYKSEEIDYDIHFVFWDKESLKPLYKEITGEEDDDETVWWCQFHPIEWRVIYIYMNTYSSMLWDWEPKETKEQFYIDTMIHETIHWVQRIFDNLQRPMTYDECEPFAYYASYRIRKWLEFVEEIKSLDNY